MRAGLRFAISAVLAYSSLGYGLRAEEFPSVKKDQARGTLEGYELLHVYPQLQFPETAPSLANSLSTKSCAASMARARIVPMSFRIRLGFYAAQRPAKSSDGGLCCLLPPLVQSFPQTARR